MKQKTKDYFLFYGLVGGIFVIGLLIIGFVNGWGWS